MPRGPVVPPRTRTSWTGLNRLNPLSNFVRCHQRGNWVAIQGMSKAELISLIQKSLGKEVSGAQAERALAAVIDGIKAGVKKTKIVQLIGFGTFKVASRKARTGVNPKTGEKIKIKASKTVKFVAGKSFKSIL